MQLIVRVKLLWMIVALISTVLKLRKLSVQKSMIRERTLRIQWWQDGVTQSMEMATTLKHGLLLRPKPWLGHIFVEKENLAAVYLFPFGACLFALRICPKSTIELDLSATVTPNLMENLRSGTLAHSNAMLFGR